MTAEDLRSTIWLTKPMKPEDWFLRVMVIEHERRQAVLKGQKDPRPNEPWRICSPEEFQSAVKR